MDERKRYEQGLKVRRQILGDAHVIIEKGENRRPRMSDPAIPCVRHALSWFKNIFEIGIIV